MRLRRRCDGRQHRWTRWRWYNKHTAKNAVRFRSCRCGAIQRFVPHTGTVTIWTPDGVNSGLLDSGVTRQVYEALG